MLESILVITIVSLCVCSSIIAIANIYSSSSWRFTIPIVAQTVTPLLLMCTGIGMRVVLMMRWFLDLRSSG